MAREILNIPSDEVSYIMLGLAEGADVNDVVRRLQKTFPDQLVMSRDDIRKRIVGYILKESGVGGSTAMAVVMAVFCGFAIVSLTMFSAVVDHVREFGTLKAIGATNFDLAKLLLAQAVTCAIAGTVIGVALASQMVAKARGPELPIALPVWLIGVSFVGMIVICVTASMVALLRVRAIEPAMVFR